MSAIVTVLIVAFVLLAIAGLVGWMLSSSGPSKTSYQYVTITFEKDGKQRQREGWVYRASYVREMMYFEWVEDDIDRWEVPQRNIVELERSDWHRVEDESELPSKP